MSYMQFFTARKRSLRRLCFLHVSVCPQGGGYPSMPCRWYPMHALQISKGVSRPTPRGKFRGLAGGGGRSPGPHPGGSPGSHPRGSPGSHPRGSPGPHLGGCVSQHALRQTPPPPMDGYCRGQYASSRNAFLLRLYLFNVFVHHLFGA